MHLMLIPSADVLNQPIFKSADLQFAGWALSNRIDETDM